MRFVFANPYCHIDHLGRLAGGCVEPELDRNPKSYPHRRIIGAEKKVTPGSYRPDRDGNAPHEVHHYGQPAIQSTCDLFLVFGVEPVQVISGDPRYDFFFTGRIRDGELFDVKSEADIPIDGLARARMTAVAHETALKLAPPDTSKWVDQFALDTKVAERAVELAAEDEAKAKAKAEAEAKKNQDAHASAES